jgi:hypothetical protein
MAGLVWTRLSLEHRMTRCELENCVMPRSDPQRTPNAGSAVSSQRIINPRGKQWLFFQLRYGLPPNTGSECIIEL